MDLLRSINMTYCLLSERMSVLDFLYNVSTKACCTHETCYTQYLYIHACNYWFDFSILNHAFVYYRETIYVVNHVTCPFQHAN